ncbi:MAG: hypothetical protein K9J37_04905 [Saprospiraceae bacterium]|nr:hypothetical protein [Saprospiraceae bacterium]MCF8249226.1 hypothetical protein [Saprospiraceae bacterium]MCF8280167.1 hypothetical protein [Bacteroidales bacterium]MCF8311355.1 hypothetical protein [Saprospiraceae bacterium]MCF8442976.1 hypothetical protein [Saprospiraceae bacterium]
MKTITKQSLNERLDEPAVKMGKMALEKALSLKVDKKQIKKLKKNFAHLLLPFNRILIRYSTTQQLPGHLIGVFPGSHSHCKPTASMRIQA